jgi:hypothetical protein
MIAFWSSLDQKIGTFSGLECEATLSDGGCETNIAVSTDCK